MKNLWENNLINIEPYVAGEQSNAADLIKLNANENAYPPAPSVFEALKNFDPSDLRKYPGLDGNPLREALASYYGVSVDNVFVGNGSDDVLATAFRAFFNSKKEILFPDITYSFYPVWCGLMKIPFKKIPLNSDFTIDVSKFSNSGGIVIPNPNAPTSLFLGLDNIKKLLDNNQDCIVMIDETYIDFGGKTALPLIKDYQNLVITRTFSKSRSLAGMRIGYAFASEKLISVMNAVRDSYNSYPVDRIANIIATASLKDEEYFQNIISKIINTRENTKKELENIGFYVFPSSTNFLFAKHNKAKAIDIFEYLKKKNIYIRHFSDPKIDDYLRISIGTDDEMKKMIDEIKNYLNESDL